MAFGGGSGFTFGSSTNTNNQSSGFGAGFGANNSPGAGAFGSTSNTGFGASPAANNPFGSSTFGASTNAGGFGNNPNTSSSLFGNKTSNPNPFGSSTTTNTTGGLFGNNSTNNAGGGFNSSTAGTGGFGSTNTNNNAFGTSTSGGFGGGFGGNKPAFGASTSATPLFGQGGTGTTGGFGTTNAFGAAGSGTALGGAVPPSTGTADVAFAPVTETEGPGNNQKIAFQSINFMQPYQKYSFEELRAADYTAGRQYGNGSGQAGAFGSSTFGGGFGSTSSNNSNPFGANTTSSGGFGSNTSTAFGSGGSTGGGLFGNKPATGGLFGQQSSAGSTGGLFGTTNNASNGASLFGNNNSSTGGGFGASTGGGLFGSNNTPDKPGGLFGSSTAPGSGTAFGSNNAGGGGLFGNNNNQQPGQQSSGGLFGNNNQAQNKPGGLFGNSTSGGFGATNNQTTPSGGLFGGSNTNPGGSLFGNNNTNNNAPGSGGLFGNNNSNTSGGLFGNTNQSQNKPGGLFGGGGLGNNQQQSNTGGGLFGNAGSTNQTSGGLFGGNNSVNNGSTALGGYSFGNNQNQSQNKPGGLFGGSTNQGGALFNQSNNNNQSSLFGGSFGQSQQNQQQQQQQPQDGYKVASLLDANPYGQSSIWTGLPVNDLNNAKPLVTPLVATRQKQEREAKPPPSLRFNQSRYMTPPRRNGFGFSYSTYGTPNSAASTPGGGSLSTSMYGSRFTGGSFGRSMGKAASISNLRSQFADGDSVLAPRAFAPSASRYSSGSIRRLTIDKSIKTDLFTRPPLPSTQTAPAAITNTPANAPTAPAVNNEAPADTGSKLKKRVSFEKDLTGGHSNGDLNSQTGALVRTEEDDDDVTVDGATPPVQQSRGKELAVVPEDRESDNIFSSKPKSTSAMAQSQEDPEPGDYYMKPTRAELSRMPRDQLKHFTNFLVGRKGCGWVVFNRPVDLTSINLDDVFEKLVEIRIRAVTVYPDSPNKPPVGKALNVPSTIYVENSWPRNRGNPTSLTSGPVFDKHIIRLRRIIGTEFVEYNKEKGLWVFKVPHYTRYGLDYDDDDDDDAFGDSQLSAPPDTIDQSKGAEMSVMEIDSDHTSAFGEDDTFHGKGVPGGFGRDSMADYDTDESVIPTVEEADGSERSAFLDDDLSDDDTNMAGSYPAPPEPVLNFDSPKRPILAPGTPGKPLLDLDGDWADQLQRTISPRKQNREALREAQSKMLVDRNFEPLKPQSMRKKDFRTSIDVMNALFDKRDHRGQAEPDFEFPYAKRAKTFDESDHQLSDVDKAWHASFKPKFTSKNDLVCKTKKAAKNDKQWDGKVLTQAGQRSICISSLHSQPKLNIQKMLMTCSISFENGAPTVKYLDLPFSHLKNGLPTSVSDEERTIYDFLHNLFDYYEDEFTLGLSDQQRADFMARVRKDRLTKFLVGHLSQMDRDKTTTAEKRNPAEAALRHLTTHNVSAATEVLVRSRNFHLATMISQISNADSLFQEDIAAQLNAWREQNIISEMTEDIRALYELLAGNTGVAHGKPQAPTEDRATTFRISEKYGLDWLHVFALDLWFGKNKTKPIQDVVAAFDQKLSSQEESASPYYSNGEDPMWVILKQYSSLHMKNFEGPTFPASFDSLNKPWDHSSTWRLTRDLQTTMAADQAMSIDAERAAELITTYATELEMKGDIFGALFVLMHLTKADEKAAIMHDFILRHADQLPNPPRAGEPASKDWVELTQLLKIPQEWIHQGLAVLARSQHDSHAELRYLISAGETEEAHQCLCMRVAPRLVIDEAWAELLATIELFGQAKVPPAEWSIGGEVYLEVSRLMVNEKGMMKEARTKMLEKCVRLVIGLGRMIEGKAGREHEEGIEVLEQRVAITEMGRVVAEMMERDGVEAFAEKVSGLPLTADVSARLMSGVARDYYHAIMMKAQ